MSPAAHVRPVPRLPLGRRGGDGGRRHLPGGTTSVCALCRARAATSRRWPGPGLPQRCCGTMRRPSPGGRPHADVPARSCRKPVPALPGSAVLLAALNPDRTMPSLRWWMTPLGATPLVATGRGSSGSTTLEIPVQVSGRTGWFTGSITGCHAPFPALNACSGLLLFAIFSVSLDDLRDKRWMVLTLGSVRMRAWQRPQMPHGSRAAMVAAGKLLPSAPLTADRRSSCYMNRSANRGLRSVRACRLSSSDAQTTDAHPIAGFRYSTRADRRCPPCG